MGYLRTRGALVGALALAGCAADATGREDLGEASSAEFSVSCPRGYSYHYPVYDVTTGRFVGICCPPSGPGSCLPAPAPGPWGGWPARGRPGHPGG